MYKLIPLSLLQSLFLCSGQILFKLGLNASGPFSWSWGFFKAQLTNWWYLGCGLSFAAATVLWAYILRNFPFSIAYPLSCLSYVLGVFAAIMIFKETVSWTQWIGVFLVVSGCILIAK